MRLDGATDLGPIYAAHSSLRHRSGPRYNGRSPRLVFWRAGEAKCVRSSIDHATPANTTHGLTMATTTLREMAWRDGVVAWAQANSGNRNAIVV